MVIASKVYFNPGRLSRQAIHREIDGSLKRLGTDYLDLYIIHRFDYDTPMEETMEALNDLVKAGKVRALGASAMYGYQFYNMQLIARDHGWARFQAMENHYNLLYREDERELIPICKQMGVSLMPYSPPGGRHTSPRRPGRRTPCAAGRTGWPWASMTGRRRKTCPSWPGWRSWRTSTGRRCSRSPWPGSGPEGWRPPSWGPPRPAIWMTRRGPWRCA